jgi:predicted XRE-type DNA-binding protein
VRGALTPQLGPVKKRHSRFGGSEMEHMRIRARLLELLLDVAREDQLSWSALVHIFGISQPRVSNLLNRHIEKFNSETLIDMLARVGVRVEVKPASRDRYRRFNLPPRSG